MHGLLKFLGNDSGTTPTLRSPPADAAKSGRKTFREGHDSMRGGFGGTFDQLDRHLAKK